MKTRPLGELTLPLIGLDTYHLKGNSLRELVGEALELGYRYFDTAQLWDNEADLGAALQASGVPRKAPSCQSRLLDMPPGGRLFSSCSLLLLGIRSE